MNIMETEPSRQSSIRTVNGETTTHILEGANVVADIQGTSISKYNRGRELISMEQNG